MPLREPPPPAQMWLSDTLERQSRPFNTSFNHSADQTIECSGR